MKAETLQQAYQEGWNDCLEWVIKDLAEKKDEEAKDEN